MSTATTPRSPAKLPPGPRGGLLLGNTLPYMRDPLGYLTRAAREYGDVVRMRLGHLRTYLLVRPDHIEYILRSHHEGFIKDYLTRSIGPLVGQGLLTSEGSYWRRQRRMAQPSFQHQQVERYARQMVDLAEGATETWSDGDERDLHAEMSRLMLSIVAKTLFGADVSEEAEVVGASLEVVMEYFLDPMRWFRIREQLPLPSTRRYWRAIRRIDDIIYALIRRRRAGGDADPSDLLTRLINARDEDGGGAMTDLQLRDEAVTIYLAGHETTALAMFYAFYLLACHPEAEARLWSELDSVLGNRLPTAADMPRLPYTEWVVRETLRLYPPAWAIAREALVDFELGGFRVPKGTQLFASQYVVHRDPRWFDAPESFRPERWEGDLVKRLPRCAYFPFGDGPRICIGNHFAMMEAILVLATIARRHRLEILPGQTLELMPSITLRPRWPIKVRVRARA